MVATGRPRLPALLTLALALGLLPAGPAAREGDPAGAIRGTVFDKDFGVPLSGVRIRLVEAQMGATSSEDGVFVINKVSPGSYTLIFSKPGFERRVLPGVVVTAGRLTDIRADLATEVYEMEELVVTGLETMDSTEIAALEIRAESIILQDSISSELISKAGVSDVGGALKLVVGASVVEGKYATVRGLSDRYTGTTLNGIRVPSADPARRAVQVDLFPTGTLEGVTVTKTFTPDLQGDFTGGGVDIQTRSVPDGPVLSVSASVENDSLATRNDAFLTYDGGGAATWGAGLARRNLPASVEVNLPNRPSPALSPTSAQMEAALRHDAFTRSFTDTMGVAPDEQGFNGSLNVVGGNRYEFGIGRVLGVLGAVTYSHKYGFYEEGLNNTGTIVNSDQGLILERQRIDTEGTDKTILGVLGKVALQTDAANEFTLEVIHNQSTTDEARYQVHPEGRNQLEENQVLRYIERDVTSIQARGTHDYRGGSQLTWTAARNFTKQVEPDVRFFRNDLSLRNLTAIKPDNSTEPENTRRIWRDGRETSYQAAMNFRMPFSPWRRLEGFFKTGFYIESTDRDYVQNSFTYFPPGLVIRDPNSSDPNSPANRAFAFNSTLFQYPASGRDDLWSNAFLQSRRIGLARNSPAAPNQLLWTISPVGQDVDYAGAQDVDAAYVLAEIPLLRSLKAVAGVRFERTDIELLPIPKGDSREVEVVVQLPSGARGLNPRTPEEASGDIRDESYLPSLTLIYEMAQGMNLRAAWSRTLARPTFRELSPIFQEEFLLGDEFVGNTQLGLSKITNYDLRWEWFPRPGDVLAFSLFHKDLTDPIEYITFAVQSNRVFTSPVNFESGRVDGWELEARTSLDLISDSLSGFGIGVNYTFLDSEVDIPPLEKESLESFDLEEDTRRLQGQPEYIFNANLTYDNERTGTSAGLFYNLIGEVLLSGASRGASDGIPSVFEEPFGTLNLTLRQDLFRGWSVSFKAKNLLGDNFATSYVLPNGDDEVKTLHDLSTAYSISARWAY